MNKSLLMRTVALTALIAIVQRKIDADRWNTDTVSMLAEKTKRRREQLGIRIAK